jgi:hypothetical protein
MAVRHTAREPTCTRVPIHSHFRKPAAMRNFLVCAITLAAVCALGPVQASEAICRAESGTSVPTVVELYTSEGCSSCPPADRWLSRLKGRADVVPLAFHVTYWDRLGWPDRFASPDYTARQYQAAQLAGRAQVYTPQVIAAGRDWPSWNQWAPNTPLPAQRADVALSSPPQVSLQRDGDKVTARISAPPGARANGNARGSDYWSGYWAVVEDGYESKVRAGENSGETLRHDHVVRLYKPVAAWPAAAAQQLQLQVSRGDSAFPRRVVFVVTDPSSGRPLQAVVLGC